MRPRRLLLLCLAALAAACACAEPVAEEGAGGGGGPGPVAPDAGPPPPPAGTRVLYFNAGGDAWVSSAAGTNGRRICEGARPYPDDDGGRALCVPEDLDDPLRLFDLGIVDVLGDYPEWRMGPAGRPALSPDGGKVAFVGAEPSGQLVARLLDDGGNELGRVAAVDVLGFAGDEALLVALPGGGYGLWSLGAPEPRVVPGMDPVAVPVEPGGVLYTAQSRTQKVVHLGLDGRARDLAEGRLGGRFGTRVLVRPSFGESGDLRLLDLANPAFERVLAHPPIPFDKDLGTSLAGPTQIVLAERSLTACGAGEAASMRTTLLDIVRGEPFVVERADGGPHVALFDPSGALAVVLDTDGCARPEGTGHVVQRDGTSRPLIDFLPDVVRRAALSPDGRYLALAVPMGVRVVDLYRGTVAVAATGVEAGDVIAFR